MGTKTTTNSALSLRGFGMAEVQKRPHAGDGDWLAATHTKAEEKRVWAGGGHAAH